MRSAAPARGAAWRATRPTARSTASATASAGLRSAYGSVAFGPFRSVPDEFRELAEKEL